MPRYVAKRGRYSASGDYSRHSGHAQPADGASGTAHRGLHANNDDVENANLTRRMAPAGTRALVLGTLERILARAGGCVNRFRVLLNLYEQQPAANAVGAAPLGTLHLVAKPSAMRLSLALYSAQPGATLCALASLSGFDHFPLEHLLTRMSVVLNARPRSSVTVDLQRHCAPLLRSVEFDVELAVRLPPRTLLFSRAQSAALDALLARTELQVPRVRVHEPALKPAAWACRGDARAVADNSSDGGDQSFAGVAGLTPLQLSALTWMTWRESDSGPSLHEASTRRFAFFGGGALEFDVLSRHFALRAVDDAPPSTRGGVLATDAGVGGRADVLAALLARDFDTGASSLATELRRTLIVVSAETLDYWASVLRLSLAQRVPWTVCRRRGQHGGRACVDHSLLSKPVLLTTYGALAANQASLTRVDWHRVAFDCVAALKPGESMRDVVLRKLRAANRWVLAPNASRAFTLVGSRRPMRTIARLLLPHNQEWTRALATDEEHELQAEDGTRDANWGATARALVYFQANAGDGFVAQSIEPLLFDPSDDERRVLQAVQQRKVTLLAHRARRLHSQEPDAGDSDDSDENDQQLSVLQVLHDVTSVTAQPRQALTCTCDEHVLQRARRPNQSQQLSSAASSPGEPTQLSNSDACVAEQELQWAEAVHERHGQCAICLDEPTDAVLTQCVASLSSSSSSSLSENDSQDDGDAAQQQQAGASAARADDAQRADQPQTPAVARHFFCFRCLAAALHRQKQHDERKTCPMCRASLRQANNMIRLRRVEIAGSGGLFEWQRVPLQLGMYHHMRLQHSTRNDLDDMEDDALQRSIGVVSSAPFAQLSRTKALCSFVAQRPRGSVLVITRFDKQIPALQCALAAALNCASECVFADTLFATQRQSGQRSGNSVQQLCPTAYVLSEQKLSMLDGVHVPESVDTLVVCQALILFDPVTVDRLKLLLSAPRRAATPVTVRCLAARDSAEATACDVALPLVFQMPPCQSPAGCCTPQHAQQACADETQCNFGARGDSSVENHMDTFEELLSTLHERLTGIRLMIMAEPDVDEDFFSADEDDESGSDTDENQSQAESEAEEQSSDAERERGGSSSSRSSSDSSSESSDCKSLDDNDL